jgi:4-hydroxybenzoate polyprenyltransferase
MSGGAFTKLRALLQCASCRFGALYCVPFCAGLAAAGTLSVATALLAVAFWLALGMAIEVTNRLADRVEDTVNRPERTALCAAVGWRALARVQLVLWGLVALATAAWLARAPDALLLLLLLSGAGVGIAYSRGPRLSRRRALVFVVLSGTFVGPFCLGFAAGDPVAGVGSGARFAQLGQFVPLFWVATLFISSLAGVKDITDRAGDEAIGYRSAFVAFTERHGTAALTALAAVPFVALAGFVATGLLPARTLALLAFLPLSAGVALAVRGAHDRPADQLLVREALYHHWLAFTSATLLACYPSRGLLAAVAGAWLWWLVASRFLHWAAPLRLADLPRVAALAAAGGARRRGAAPLPVAAGAEASA